MPSRKCFGKNSPVKYRTYYTPRVCLMVKYFVVLGGCSLVPATLLGNVSQSQSRIGEKKIGSSLSVVTIPLPLQTIFAYIFNGPNAESYNMPSYSIVVFVYDIHDMPSSHTLHTRPAFPVSQLTPKSLPGFLCWILLWLAGCWHSTARHTTIHFWWRFANI